MKTALKIILVVILIVAPSAGKALWYYQGFYHRATPVALPEYASFTEPTPPLSSKTLPAPAVSQKPAQPVILVDLNHGNDFTMSELEPYFQRIEASGGHLEGVTVDSAPLSEGLKYASTYIVVAPLSAFRPEEIQAVQNFITRGGRLLVITDATRSGTVSDPFGTVISTADAMVANMLLASYQISVQSDYLYNLKQNEGNFRNVLFKQFGKSTLTDGLSTVVFYAAHSIAYAPQAATGLVQGDAQTLSSDTDAPGKYSSLVLSKNGNVLVLGDLTFLTQPYDQVADNSLLMSHMVDFVMGGERVHDLADFPYLFTRPVAAVPGGTLQVNSELVSALSGVQSALLAINIPITLKASAAQDEDLVVLGLYDDASLLSSYLEPFKLSPDDFPSSSPGASPTATPSITLPGFGKVESTGTGLILYSPSPGRNTLVLLAGSEADLQTLIGLMNSTPLTGCLTSGQMALCSLASSSTSSGYGSGGFDYPTDTPTP